MIGSPVVFMILFFILFPWELGRRRPDRGLFQGRCTQRNRTDACCYKSIEAKEMREEKKEMRISQLAVIKRGRRSKRKKKRAKRKGQKRKSSFTL
jgi:hypothetical protein